MNLNELPDNLPVPKDDGLASHLIGLSLPDLIFTSTANDEIHLDQLSKRTVIYVYPMTGRPDVLLPDGWDEIPGARGCTPQSCSFRDHYSELKALDTDVFGLSTQSTEYQSEAKQRLHLPFELLSDANLVMKEALHLPTFEVDDMTLYKRITLIVEAGVITKTFYPVFPPSQNAEAVISWLRAIE